MNYELSPRAKQERTEKNETHEWFKDQFGEGTQVRVKYGAGWYDTSVTKAQPREAADGSVEFMVVVPVDGQFREFVSDRPDQFDDLERIG